MSYEKPFHTAFSFAGVKGVKVDTFVQDAIVEVSAFTPKPTCRLITPFDSSNSFR